MAASGNAGKHGPCGRCRPKLNRALFRDRHRRPEKIYTVVYFLLDANGTDVYTYFMKALKVAARIKETPRRLCAHRCPSRAATDGYIVRCESVPMIFGKGE